MRRGFLKPRRAAGDTLIEVMVALLLLAVAALGTVALQSWVSRSQQSARWLDLAVSAATIVVEALRAGESPNASMALADSTTADLPDGRVSLTTLAEGQWVIVVGWTEPRLGSGVAPADGNGAGRQGRYNAAGSDGTPCSASGGVVGGASGSRAPRCVSLVFVR